MALGRGCFPYNNWNEFAETCQALSDENKSYFFNQPLEVKLKEAIENVTKLNECKVVFQQCRNTVSLSTFEEYEERARAHDRAS